MILFVSCYHRSVSVVEFLRFYRNVKIQPQNQGGFPNDYEW